MTALVHITPHYPPQIDGIGNYAELLARHLRDGHAIESRFIVGDPSWRESAGTADSFDARMLSERSADALQLALGETDCVLLHYVGYGYQSRGVPLWLVRGLEQWKRARASRRLLIIFHELWSFGPPWRSEFYLSLVQRNLVVRLHRMADAALASTPISMRALEKIAPGKTFFQPIARNLPAVDFAKRTPHGGGPVRVAVFGLEATRLRSVKTHAKLLRALHAERLLAGVEAVGKGARAGDAPSRDVGLLREFLPEELVSAAGDVSPEEASERLARADLFLSFYPSAFLCKSSALTSALACGCVAVLAEARDAAPLVEGRELVACDGSAEAIARTLALVREGKLHEIAGAGWLWQDRNASWKNTAQRVAALFQSRNTIRAGSED